MLYGEIDRQRLKITKTHVVADTIDYLEARFVFSDDWDGLEKWAHFSQRKTGVVYDIRLTDDCIRKEDHLNLSAGLWRVYLHGSEYVGGEVVERITTDIADLEVRPTGMLNGEPFPTVPPSAGEQIIASAQAAEAGAVAAAERSETASGAAGTSADIAKTAAETAVSAKNDAAGSVQSAAKAAENAAGSAASAELSAERAEQAAAENGYAAFEIQDDGCLYLSRTANIAERVDFRLTDAGDLEVIVNG